ncbi:MAG: hypothetical protein ABS36_00945 [Acidobacteria bacterium SCN 69-37]|nr:MAG: hypothetical protein ABS36_00945 [Acidobacteria bacterium SCN 69-37]
MVAGAVMVAGVCGLLSPVTVSAQMDLRQAAGVPLPAAELPAGSVSVRVVRGSFANNLVGETVVFLVDGQERRVVTDAAGRAQIDGLAPGTRLRAVATVDDERLESQEVTIGSSGIRFILVATDAGAEAAPPVAAVPGSVIIGPDSRIVIDYSNELLNVYYVVQVLNQGPAPVDLGGPLVITLPTEARSATLMEGATPQATVSGTRVTVRSPFAPGRTDVNVAFTLPYNGDTAHLEQHWPTDVQPFAVFALKTGEMDLVSAQLQGKQTGVQQGQTLVMGRTPAMASGETLVLAVTGLPHRSTWPRNVALGLAGAICLAGFWGAFGPGARRQAA